MSPFKLVNRPILILILGLALAGALFWLLQDSSIEPESNPSDLETQPSSERNLDAAPRSGELSDTEETRARVSQDRPQAGLLLSARLTDGRVANDARFFLRSSERQWVLDAENGSAVLAEATAPVTVAAVAGGRWSQARILGEEDLQGEQVFELSQAAGLLTVVAVDATGAPMPEFDVELTWAGGARGEGSAADARARLYQACRATWKGRQGAATDASLPSGQYSLRVTSAGAAPAATSVELKAGADETVRVEMVAGGSVTARLLDESGDAIEGAQVFLLPEFMRNELVRMLGSSDRLRRLAGQEGRTQSGADGRFVLGPIGQGSYRLLVRTRNRPDALYPRSIEIESGRRQDLGDWTLPQGRVLVVDVRLAEDGQPVAGARVLFSRGSRSADVFADLRPWTTPEQPDTNEEGRVEIAGLEAGPYALLVRADGLAQQELEFELPAGEEPFVHTVLLLGELAIRGQVVAAGTGAPIEGASILASRASDTNVFEGFLNGEFGNEGSRNLVISDAEGRFRLLGLGAGGWRLKIEAEGFAMQEVGPIQLLPGAAEPDRRIEMLQGGTLLVKVLDEQGQPRPNVQVSAFSFGLGGSDTAKSDDNGELSFEHLPAGTYMVSAQDRTMGNQMLALAAGNMNFKMESQTVSLEEAETLEVTLGGIVERAIVQGHITRSQAPVEKVTVMLFSGSGFMETKMTDEVGFFEFEGVPKGTYIVRAGQLRFGSGAGWVGNLSIEGGETVTYDIELPTAAIRIRVTDADTGEPIAGVPALLRPEHGSQAGGNLNTDGDGEVTFEYVQEGTYALTVGFGAMPFFGGGKGHATQNLGPITIAADQSEEIYLEASLQRAATLTGTVIGTDGQPVTGAGVFLLDESAQPLSMFSMRGTDRSGKFELGSLPPGRVRVVAKHPEYGQVEQETWLTSGETQTVDLQLETGALVYILVQDSEGEVIPGVQAVLVDERGAPISLLYTGREAMDAGMAFLQGRPQKVGPVKPGEYQVVLSMPGTRSVREKVEIPAGQREVYLSFDYEP